MQQIYIMRKIIVIAMFFIGWIQLSSAGQCPELSRELAYWKGGYERTPGRFWCQNPDAVNIKVVNDRWPDCSDLREFGRDAIRLSGAETEHEKALAVWRWMRRIKSSTNGHAPTDPFNPERKGAEVNDPVKLMNVFGAHWCSGLGRLTALIWRSLGYEAHALHRFSHGMAALKYQDTDGISRYHLFDCNFGGFTLDRSGQRVLGPDEFSTDYYMWMYPWYFGETWPMPTHRADLTLRQGEKLSRSWGNWGKPFQDNFSAKKDKRYRSSTEKGPYPVTYGNGKWVYEPDISSADWVQGLAEPIQNMTKAKLMPARPGQWGQAVWHFRSPYIMVQSEIELDIYRKSPDDRIRLYFSVDDGRTWQPIWRSPQDMTGHQKHTVRLDERFKVVPGKWKVPKDFTSPFGRYAYRIKLEMKAHENRRDCRVAGIAFKTTVQHNIRALPQLWPGKNTITISGELEQDCALKVSYIWDDLQGKGRKNVTVAETLPYEYDIVTSGQSWDDVVCKDIIVECVPDKGQVSRTMVKEEPSRLYDLPAMKPAKQTRTRWVRPVHREQHKPSVSEVRSWLSDTKKVAKGLIWAAELADTALFAAVREAAFDPQVCRHKQNKQRAIVALYNIDPHQASKELLRIANDHELVTGWKVDPENRAVAGGHWMSVVCIIGQMAAEAGWHEFVPSLAGALESPYCGDHHRMSILRSMSQLVEPGDVHALKVIRESLDMSYPYMLAQAARAAGEIEDAASIPRLRELLDHSFLVVRRNAAVALGKLKDKPSAPELRLSLFAIRKPELLDHTKYGTEICFDENMRAAAAKGLGLMQDKESLSYLREALAKEPVHWVKKVIEEALERMKK